MDWCPLPFSCQNQIHVDFRPRGSLANGLVWCFPNRVPWHLSIPCGHPWRPAPPDSGLTLSALLSSRFSFVAALAPPSHFLFGHLPPTHPSVSCPCVVVFPLAAPPPPASFGVPGSAPGRRRRRLSQWPEPCPGSSRGSGAEAGGTPETGQCGGSAAAGTEVPARAGGMAGPGGGVGTGGRGAALRPALRTPP